jgi:uncharacterized cofD-like protein
MPKDSNFPRVVTVGGGTGTYICLSALKEYPVQLSAIVTMMDSGGSTGKLRDQLGVLPPGDVRQALVALSDCPEIWRKLFSYRFDNGDLKGHSFGNLFISSLEKITGSTVDAIGYAERLLQTKGHVIPVTLTKSNLCAKYADGKTLFGEATIDESIYNESKLSYIYLDPPAEVNLDAKRALERADAIIFGPGDLHTSILPNLLIENMPEVLSYTKAKKIYVVNLMTRKGQTDNFKASDFVDEFSKYLYPAKLDYVLVNSTRPSKELADWYYQTDGTVPVKDDLGGCYGDAVVLRRNLLSKTKFYQSVADRVKRSLIRHDPDSLGRVLIDIINDKL